MSSLGMGIAASVTQAAVQSQQVGRSQHRQQTDAATEARRLRERIEDHFQALEEGDDAAISQLRIGDREGDGQSHAQPQKQPTRPAAEPAEAAISAQTAAPGKPAADAGTLYHHVDITA